MRTALLILSLALTGAGSAVAQTGAFDPVVEGRRIFTHTCAPCHGAGPGDDGSKMLPGTAALAAKYKGAKPAELERRGDLSPETLRYFVRHGSGAMPMFRKTEITDAEINEVAAYLKQSAKQIR